jgi:hypothetical protein
MFAESLFLILYSYMKQLVSFERLCWLDVGKCLSQGFFANFGWRISMGSGNCHFLLGKNCCHNVEVDKCYLAEPRDKYRVSRVLRIVFALFARARSLAT